MSQLSHVRAAAAKVTGALGTLVTFTRREPQGGGPQGAYSLGSGLMSEEAAGSMSVRATPAPVDPAMLPESLMNLELQRWRVASADCTVFWPARGHRMALAEGPAMGAAFIVRHVGRSASDAVIDVYAGAVGGAAGLPSAGEDAP